MKEIPLSGGFAVALVDDEDFDFVSSHRRWELRTHHLSSRGVAYRYAETKVIDRTKRSGVRTVQMHRVILNAPKGLIVDHINHDGLDNRRANLRLCTHQQNMANRRKSRGTGSRYIGVYWHKDGKTWAATCGNRHVGLFKNEIDAALARDRVAREEYGEFAALNFPNGIQQSA